MFVFNFEERTFAAVINKEVDHCCVAQGSVGGQRLAVAADGQAHVRRQSHRESQAADLSLLSLGSAADLRLACCCRSLSLSLSLTLTHALTGTGRTTI